MIINFEIEDNYALTYNGRHIDLHNNFDFIHYQYKIEDRELVLTWIKSSGDWVSEAEFSKLTLIHSNVFFVNIGYDNKDYEHTQDDKCLSEISFFPSSDRQNNNAFISQKTPTDGDDIIYIFEREHFIRIGCGELRLIAE